MTAECRSCWTHWSLSLISIFFLHPDWPACHLLQLGVCPSPVMWSVLSKASTVGQTVLSATERYFEPAADVILRVPSLVLLGLPVAV